MIKKNKTIIKFVAILLFFNLPHLIAQETKTNTLNPGADKIDNYVIPINIEFTNGNWESGKKILDEGLAKHSKYSDFHMLLGKYYLHYKEYDKARYALHKALEYDPNNVGAKHILVNVEEQTQRYSSAIGYVNELLEVTPYWKGLWRKKIALYEKQGNKEEAARLRKRILEIYPEDRSLLDDYIYYAGEDAREKANEGNMDEAIKILIDILNKEPDKPQHYNHLINAYLKNGDLYNALAYTDRGLKHFPNNKDLLLKKTGILAAQNRYDELLPFLLQKGMTEQYNYYLLQAAQTAKDQQPAVLYGKVFTQNPGNYEAFSYVFNDAMNKHQYQEALNILNTYRNRIGNSKEIAVRELEVYQRMGNTSRADALTLELFEQYPDDYDIKHEYVQVKLKEAKNHMKSEQYENAISNWKEIIKYGEDDLVHLAKLSKYDAYYQLSDYNKAHSILNQLIDEHSENVELYIKKASIYYKKEQFNLALSAYERAIQLAKPSEKERHLSGYADMMTNIIKFLDVQYRYDISYRLVKRWLEQDPTNELALHYAFNLANLMGENKAKLKYANMGHELYPENIFFTIKLAEIASEEPDAYEQVFQDLNNKLGKHPYHKELIDAFTDLTSTYGRKLIKDKESQKAIAKIDTALYYAPDSRVLKYTKGLAFEQLHQYDSAYYYQSYYKPETMEADSFKQHLQYLDFRSKPNQVGLNHLRSRHGDNPSISTISAFEYTRFGDKNTYTGRANYTGRALGKGIQIQGEWSYVWNDKTYTTINAAWANKFFPRWNFNGSIYRYVDFADGIQFEAGVGYREFYKNEMPTTIENTTMYNIVIGTTKQINSFRLNARFNNFLLDETYMYNLSLDNRYFLSSPQNYIMGVASIGTSPDVELVNYHLYDGFDIFNTMVGAGFGHMLYKNISMSVLGTWYNYKTNNTSSENIEDFKNLYNIYLHIHVAF